MIIDKSAKILLLPPKYEIIKLPSNHSFLQYCDREEKRGKEKTVAVHLVIQKIKRDFTLEEQ